MFVHFILLYVCAAIKSTHNLVLKIQFKVVFSFKHFLHHLLWLLLFSSLYFMYLRITHSSCTFAAFYFLFFFFSEQWSRMHGIIAFRDIQRNKFIVTTSICVK